MDSFKQEFLKVLDERDFLDGAYTRIRDDFNNLDVEYRNFKS